MDEHAHILKAILSGDKNAHRMCYDTFKSRVYNTALSYVQNVADAEEITQDTFVKVFRNAARFEGNSQLSTWVYRITVNTALSHIRKQKRRSFLQFGSEIPDKPDFEHPGILLENKEKAVYLFKAIETLPSNQQTAFILSFVEGLPRKEVAAVMEMSVKAIESLLQRGKKNLRNHLSGMYPHRSKKRSKMS